MIDSDYCRLMATYNAWMNRKLYTVCASLPKPDLYADRAPFFNSNDLTLNHIAYADLAFLSRFTGDPADVPSLGVDLFCSFESLHAGRQRLDDRLLHWVASMSTDWLASPLSRQDRSHSRLAVVHGPGPCPPAGWLNRSD